MTLSETPMARRGLLGAVVAGGLAVGLTAEAKSLSVDAPTKFVTTGGRRLAYRAVGTGRPIVLCTRFRGTIDDWDPLFLDSLVAQGFQVITFDYTGLGFSTGEKSLNPFDWAKDARDLVEALQLKSVVLLGWSLGGIAAQAALAVFPGKISHLVLVGTVPPGPVAKLGEPLFYEAAARENDFEDEVILFFEPNSPASRAAARASHNRIAAARASGRRRCPTSGRRRTWATSPRPTRSQPRRSWRSSRPPRSRSCISAATTT